MIKFLISFKELIFGKNSKTAFIRFMILLSLIGFFLIAILNVGCGVKDSKFYFEWRQADVSIKKEV